MTRFRHAVEVAIENPARTVRGDTRQVLPDVLASVPAGLPVCSIDSSVLGMPVSPAVIERNRREGLFGVVGRLGYCGGRRTGALLGLAHPGAAWLEWLESEPS